MNCKNTNSCCSPYSQLAQRLEETTIRAVQAYNIAVQGLRNPVDGTLTVNGDLQVNGDILQNGAAYETHAEKVYTNDDYIIMRDGAVSALSAGDYSGFQVTKYDGTNDGRLVIDNAGTARVGDVGDEQPLATRDESTDLTDGHLVKWDAANLKLTDAGVGIDGVFEHVCNLSTGVWITAPYVEELETFTLPTGYKFEEKYDYFIFMHNASASTVNVTMKEYARSYTRDTNVFQMYVQASDDFYATFDVYRVRNEASTPSVPVHVVTPDSTDIQEKLVSGTNIKTVGGQSLLGSGDVPAGGLTWTLRTPNDDWTDMFEINSGVLVAKKHIYLTGTTLKIPILIPKGYTESPIKLTTPIATYSGNKIYTMSQYEISTTNIQSGVSTISGTRWGITLTTDGSTISTASTSALISLTKSNIVIYTAD